MPKCKDALEENVKPIISEFEGQKQALSSFSAESVAFLRFLLVGFDTKARTVLISFISEIVVSNMLY